MTNLADTNGISLAYEIEGNGFPIVLIHGFGATKSVWKPQLKDLSEHFQVIIYDIRGAGESSSPDVLYTMDMLVEDLKGLLEFLGIKRCHLAGRSLGGMIAQNFVIKYPEMVEKLVLITTNYGMPDDKIVDMTIENRVKELALLKSQPEQSFWNKAKILYHRNFLKHLKNHPDEKVYGIWNLNDLIKENAKTTSDVNSIQNLGHSMKTHNTYNELINITPETLLIAATHDKLTPLSVMEEMNTIIPKSELHVIQNAGHFVTISYAKEVNQIILSFLQK